MDAASAKNIEMTKILIRRGSKINVQSKSEQTALMMAVGRGCLEIVKLLLDAKADITLKDVLGMTALRYAQIIENESIQNYLKEYIKRNKIVLEKKWVIHEGMNLLFTIVFLMQISQIFIDLHRLKIRFIALK